MQITGGKVVFSRSVQPAQYETKKAEVEIQFTLAEGEKLENQLDIAAKFAQDKALEMVGLQKPAVTTAAPKAAVPTKAQGETTPAEKTGKEAAAEKLNAADTKKAKAPPKTGAAISTGEERKDPDNNDISDLLGETPAEVKTITDKDLSAACNAQNGKMKEGAPSIRKLIEKFAGPLPKQVRDIPQEKRQAFLDELKALT